MKAVIAVIFVALFAAAASAAPVRLSQFSPGKATPDERARQWLTLLDDGDYGRSWQESGNALRSREGAATWTSQIKAMREPLGAMTSRNLRLIELVNSERVVVRYDSVFAHKATAQETVTLGLENGGWAVIDYALK